MLQDYLSEFSGLLSQAEDLLSQLSRREENREGKTSLSSSSEGCGVNRTDSSSSGGSEVAVVALQQQRLDNFLTKMKRCFSTIELELRCLPREERARYQDTVEICRRQLELLQRKALLAGGKVGRSSSSSSVAARHRNTTEALRQGNLQLSQSCRLASEAGALGESAICSLYLQRETISRALSRSKEVQENVRQADTLLHKMSKWWNGIW